MARKFQNQPATFRYTGFIHPRATALKVCFFELADVITKTEISTFTKLKFPNA